MIRIKGKAKITISAGSQEWAGSTQREAREAQQKHLDRLFSVDSTPGVVIAGCLVGVVWQTHSGGWAYRIHENGQGWSVCDGFAMREDATATMRVHMAQQLTKIDPDACEVIVTRDLLIALGDAPKVIAEYDTWRFFQQRYAQAKKAGASDQEAHEIGGNGPRSRELIKRLAVSLETK